MVAVMSTFVTLGKARTSASQGNEGILSEQQAYMAGDALVHMRQSDFDKIKGSLDNAGKAAFLNFGIRRSPDAQAEQSLILKANPGLDPAHLKVGQKITLPASGSTGATGTISENASDSLSHPVTGSTSGSESGESYIVKSGDTLWSIAKAKLGDGSKKDLIVNANPGLDASRLKIGQKLVIPAGTGSSVSTDSGTTGTTSRPAAHATHAKKTKSAEPSNRPIFD
jgi:LysM repeat protein